MVGTTSNWEDELRGWLKPFLDRLGHKSRRRMCPLYVAGLIGPGDRKSVQPMAERLAPGDYDQLHHFVAAGVWDAAPLETELLIQADRLVGGSDAVLVIDDTAVPKKGTHSVGVAAQYASALGKTANCQTLVSLTLARGEVPVMVALRLFLPDSWVNDRRRLKRAGVPAEYRTSRTKPEIALAEIDHLISIGVRFRCVLADAGYGLSAPFRQLDDGTIADQFYDAAVAGGDSRVEDGLSVPLQSSQRARLVGPHQARIADHIGREDCRQFAVDACVGHEEWVPGISAILGAGPC